MNNLENNNGRTTRSTRNSRRGTLPPTRRYNFRPSTIFDREFSERQRQPHRLRIRGRLRRSPEDIVDLSSTPSIPRAFFEFHEQLRVTNPSPDQSGLSRHQIEKNTLQYDYQPKKHPIVEENNEIDNDNEKNVEILDQNDKCCICLDEFSSRNVLRRLQCLHLFHTGCIDKWLKDNKNCPLCRVPVIVDYGNLIRSLESGPSVEQILERQGSSAGRQLFVYL